MLDYYKGMDISVFARVYGKRNEDIRSGWNTD